MRQKNCQKANLGEGNKNGEIPMTLKKKKGEGESKIAAVLKHRATEDDLAVSAGAARGPLRKKGCGRGCARPSR